MSSIFGLNLLKNVSRCASLRIKPNYIRFISTSKKNRDTATVTNEVQDNPVCEVDKKKNWISYGFSVTDYDEDRHFMHMILFMGVTVIFCFGGMLLAYRPDDLGRDWAQREAFLELRRREKLGLPLVDPDYIPANKIILPSDEELGDTEIVI